MARIGNFLRHANPLNALGDLGRELSTPYPHRFKLMALAGAVTLLIFSTMWKEGGRGLPKPPEITYVQSFAPNRSEAEIVAGNIAASKAAREAEAEEAAAAQREREVYKAIGRASGIDVDAIEKQAKIDQAAEDKQRAAEQARMPKARVARVNE